MPFAVARPDRDRSGAVVAGVGMAGPELLNVRGLTDDLRSGPRRAAAKFDQRRSEPARSSILRLPPGYELLDEVLARIRALPAPS